MFTTISLPFDDYRDLDVAAGPRWLMICLARYSDRAGGCFPSLRALAADVKKSRATVSRWLKQLGDLGCFTRTREAGRVYRYTIAEAYRLRWRDPPKPAAPAAPETVAPQAETVAPEMKQGVSQRATQEAKPSKHVEESGGEVFKWRARLRQWRERGMWVASYGPFPGQPGCRVPSDILAACGGAALLQGARR